MAGITVSHLSFTYPQETVPALQDVSFSVEEGEFLTLIGPSGGGKSTLLRALKPALTPHGSFTGEISFFGEPLSALDARRQAAEIGFVLQKPEDVYKRQWISAIRWPSRRIRRTWSILWSRRIPTFPWRRYAM